MYHGSLGCRRNTLDKLITNVLLVLVYYEDYFQVTLITTWSLGFHENGKGLEIALTVTDFPFTKYLLTSSTQKSFDSCFNFLKLLIWLSLVSNWNIKCYYIKVKMWLDYAKILQFIREREALCKHALTTFQFLETVDLIKPGIQLKHKMLLRLKCDLIMQKYYNLSESERL